MARSRFPINFASRNLSTGHATPRKEGWKQEPRASTRGGMVGRRRRQMIKDHACQGVVFYKTSCRANAPDETDPRHGSVMVCSLGVVMLLTVLG